MDFFNLNNNIEPNNVIKDSIYQDNHKINTPVPMLAYENCPMTEVQYDYKLEDDNAFIEKCCEEQKDDNKDKITKIFVVMSPLTFSFKACNDARVVVEKLPDSVVQKYLAKKPKDYEAMDFGKKSSHLTVQHSVKREIYRKERRRSSLLKRSLIKEENSETDRFFNQLCNPVLQQDLAKTEMGVLGANLIDLIPESQEYPAKPNTCSVDNLIENLSGDVDMQNQKDDYVENFAKSNLQQHCLAETAKDHKPDPHPLVHQYNINPFHLPKQEIDVDVEKLDDSMETTVNVKSQENVSTKKTIRRVKIGSKHKHCRKNITTNQCRRVCLICYTYVQKTHKVSAKVKCDKCDELTVFECNKCKKLAHTYSGIADHLLYRCEARELYKCAHCKYAVTKKSTLAWHMNKLHENLILQQLMGQKNRRKSILKIAENKLHKAIENGKHLENVIVLKKQREVTRNSEWYVENVKRRDSRVNKSMGSSVSSLPSVSSKTISNLPEENSSSAKGMVHLYCQHCNRKIAIDDFHNTEIYCRMCGTVLVYKCLKCNSTCDSHHGMKHHLKNVCAYREKNRDSFHCSECNYRSFFQGLVTNHLSKVHGFNQSPGSHSDGVIQDYSENN